MSRQYLWYEEDFTRLYGCVSRTRGHYLYTQKGKRLTDMYAESGRALLGWGNTASPAMTMFKNMVTKGLTGSFPTGAHHRLEKAVRSLLPEVTAVGIYTSIASVEKALKEYCGEAAFTQELLEVSSAEELVQQKRIVRWRPWLGMHKATEGVALTSDSTVEAYIVVPPLPWASELYVVGYTCNGAEAQKKKIPADDVLPPALVLAAARSFYDLKKILPLRGEKNWKLFDKVLSLYWQRTGPYLVPKVPKEQYNGFFLHCLQRGLFISPYYGEPSLVPYGVTEGDFKLLEKEPFLF